MGRLAPRHCRHPPPPSPPAPFPEAQVSVFDTIAGSGGTTGSGAVGAAGGGAVVGRYSRRVHRLGEFHPDHAAAAAELDGQDIDDPLYGALRCAGGC